MRLPGPFRSSSSSLCYGGNYVIGMGYNFRAAVIVCWVEKWYLICAFSYFLFGVFVFFILFYFILQLLGLYRHYHAVPHALRGSFLYAGAVL